MACQTLFHEEKCEVKVNGNCTQKTCELKKNRVILGVFVMLVACLFIVFAIARTYSFLENRGKPTKQSISL